MKNELVLVLEQYNHIVWLLLGNPAELCIVLHCIELDYSLAVSWLPLAVWLQMAQEKNVQFGLELPTETSQCHRYKSWEMKDFSRVFNRHIYLLILSLECGGRAA